ncbi:MAG: hypothetical protein AAFY41_00350 [Bacteroidota bacterium]
MKVYEDSFYIVEVDTSKNLLSFIWKDDHPEVDHERFIASCCNFIGYGFEYRSDKILIDTKNFTYTPTPAFYEWQKTVHHERYKKVGIKKVAYILHSEYLAQVKNMPKEDADFDTEYFDNDQEAYKWLLN